MDLVIVVTRLNGPQFAVNPDLVQRIDSAPDTILTLIDGTKYIVAESMDEVVSLLHDYRSSVIARAQDLRRQEEPDDEPHLDAGHAPVRLVPPVRLHPGQG